MKHPELKNPKMEFPEIKYPEIIDFDFEPGMDRPINSALVKAAYKAFDVKFVPGVGFTSKIGSWAVCIQDQHAENEPEAHYVFMIGEGDWAACDSKSFEAIYCDYHSTTNKEEQIAHGEKPDENEDEVPILPTAPGKWKITVWLPNGILQDRGEKCAEIINAAYVEVMDRVLPDYYIPSSEIMPVSDS